MAVLLMLMFRHRGVLLPQQIAPVYTFGAPALFCDGALGGCSACNIGADGTEACTLVGATHYWGVQLSKQYHTMHYLTSLSGVDHTNMWSINTITLSSDLNLSCLLLGCLFSYRVVVCCPA